jgi:hypothetical protein
MTPRPSGLELFQNPFFIQGERGLAPSSRSASSDLETVPSTVS